MFQNEDLIDKWQDYFESYIDLTYGKCFRFNSGINMFNQSMPIKYAKNSGLDEGLWFDFYLESNYYLNNLMIYIHNNTQIPSTIFNKGFILYSGSETYFNVKRVYDQKLELPYNSCYKNVTKSSDFNQTIIDYLNEMKRKYTQKECLHLCRNLKYKEINPCDYIPKSLDEDIFTLKNDTANQCIYTYLNESYNFQLCSTLYCPLECDSFTYDISLNSQHLIGYGNISLNSSFLYPQFNTYENVTRTFYSISIYYEDLKYTLIQQQPKIELFGLISNIGGTLGLFLGFSFISLLELFEIFVELVFIKLNFSF